MRRRSVLKYGGLATVGALAGCSGGGDGGGGSDGPLKIGALAPTIIPMGVSGALGARIAVDELNENGGVLDRDVELSVEDTEASAATASSAVNDFINNENVDIIVGGYASEVALGIIDRVAEEGVPYINTGSTATAITTENIGSDYERYKNVFCQAPNQAMQLPRQADYMAYLNERHGWDTAAVMVEDAEWTQTTSDELPGMLEDRGFDVAMNERFPLDTSDYSPLLNRAESNDVDVVWKSLALTDGTSLLSTWSSNEYPFAMEGINGASYASEYWSDTNGNCEYEGVMTPGPTSYGAVTEKTDSFTQAYEERSSERPQSPIYMAFYTYDAIKLWAEVVEAVGSADYSNELDAIVEEMENIEFTGSSGSVNYQGPDEEYPHTVHIGEDAVPMNNGQWRSTDDGGTQELVWPEAVRTADHEAAPWL